MTTNWAKPKLITQYAETGGENIHVPWDFNSIENFGIFPIKLNGTLKHIARSPKPDLLNKTYYVKFSQFQFTQLPTTIQGIEVRLDVSRHGRITDDTIQVVSSFGNVGDNLANLTINNNKTYTLPFSGDTFINVDETFGVTLRFQSHPKWPHNETVIINSVELRLY